MDRESDASVFLRCRVSCTALEVRTVRTMRTVVFNMSRSL